MFVKKYLVLIVFLLSSIAALADQKTTAAQRLLNDLGYNAGSVDGAWGKKTRTSLEQFYIDQNLRFDGTLDQQELKLLKREYAKLVAKILPNRVANWNKINGEYRDDKLDCRSKQRGIVPVKNQPT